MSEWWCSGFFPGTLLYLYEETGKTSLYNCAKQKLKILEKEQHNTSTHDLGFMMYCSFGNAQKTVPSKSNQAVLIASARSLIKRFSPATGCIRSWDSKNARDYLVIIDNMMNLELLFYAARVTGDSTFYKIAVSHADKTLLNHFRPDHSSFHVVDYNAGDGSVISRKTAQGASDTSVWARGQGWGLYGYTMMYRETRDRKYLDHANKIAAFILNNPKLPADMIPYWDFDAPGIPHAYRDASAGALYASALLELSTYTEAALTRKYYSAAEKILQSLSGKNYHAAIGDNGGFLLKHSVGNMPEGSEIDAPLSYADYYYVEALIRYKKIAQSEILFPIRNQ